jgi:protein-S-isoprenylcysteine O-methyltransferase Ste14
VGVWLLGGTWIAFCLYWGAMARGAAATLRRPEDPGYRWNLLAVVVGLFLILTEVGDLGPLAIPVLAKSAAAFWVGFGVTLAGMALAIWARRRLGPLWASWIDVKQDHRLVTDGPYRLLRHPIYAGIILAALGSGISDPDVGSVAGVSLIAVGFVVKLRREERFMAAEFGDEWRAWRARTWALVPFVL